MSFLSDILGIAKSAIPAVEQAAGSGLGKEVVAVAESLAPAPVKQGIATVEAWLATEEGQAIEHAFGLFVTHVVGGTGGSVLAEPLTDKI